MEPQKKNFKIVTDKKSARVILPNMLTLIGVCIGLTSIRFALDGIGKCPIPDCKPSLPPSAVCVTTDLKVLVL